MQYLSSYVQRPTTAPNPSDPTPGTFELAHQRQNRAGGYSEARVLTGLTLPNTVTLQAYSDPAELLSDRVLVRQSGMTTWKEVPASAIAGQTVTLPLTIPTSWVTVSNEQLADNQALSPISGLDFGTFSSASEPERSVYLLNDGADTISSLSLLVRGGTGQTLEILDNRVQLDILGTLGQTGLGGLTTTFNGSLVFGLQSRNTLNLTLGPNQVAKLRFSLVNFPATGLPSEALSAEIVLVPNRTRTSAPVWLDWPVGTMAVNDQYEYLGLVTDNLDGGVTVEPHAVRLESSVVFRDTPVDFTPNDGNTRYRVAVNPVGQLGISPVSQALGEDLELYQFDWSSSGGVSNGLPSAPGRASRVYLPPNGVINPNRFVGRVGGGIENGSAGTLGIAADELGNYVNLGYALLELGGNVAVDTLLGPDSSGLGVADLEGPARALTAGSAGDTIPVYLTLVAATSSAGTTDLSVSRGSSSVTVASSTGTNAVLFGSSTSQAGVMIASDKVKLNGIETGATQNSPDSTLLSRANHTGTQASSTISDFDEAVQDTVAALVTDGAGITSTYDDAGASLTLDVSFDLSASRTASQVTITNPLGSNAVISSASTSLSGVMSSTDKTKLDGIEAGSTQNSTDATLLARANHTGTQAISTVSGLQTALDGKVGRGHVALSSFPGTAVSIPGATWVDPEGAGYAFAVTESVMGSGFSRSGKWTINIPTGFYLVTIGGYISFTNSTSTRVLLGMNQGTYRLHDLVNSNSVFNADNQFQFTTLVNLPAGSFKPSCYVDVNAGPVLVTFRTFNFFRLNV